MAKCVIFFCSCTMRQTRKKRSKKAENKRPSERKWRYTEMGDICVDGWNETMKKTMSALILNALDNTVIKARFSIQLIENQCFGNG